MTKSIYILFSLFVLSLPTSAQVTSIIDDLNTTKNGEGKITIYQDESIKNMVGSSIQNSKYTDTNTLTNQLSASSDSTSETENTSDISKNFVRAKGFKIQAYSGSDQKRSKNEAQARKNTIASNYPNMEVTVTYNSPVWRVKAGNFKTREEASQALSEMKSKFPSFGREMNIVNDVIRIPVD